MGAVALDQFFRMVNIQSVLPVYILVGVLVKKIKIVTAESQQSMIDLMINITLPCMVFNSFQPGLSLKELMTAFEIILVAMGIIAFSYAVGKLLFRKIPFRQRSILQYGAMLSNSSFAGLPLVDSLYGQMGLFYGSLFILPNRIFLWTAGISLFTDADAKTRLKNALLNPGIVAVELGILRMLTNFPVHPIAAEAIRNIGNCTGPMSMMMIGCILADNDPRTVFSKRAVALSFVRLILLPLSALAALRLIGFDPVLTGVSVVLTGMPVATTTAILAQKYGADAQFGSKCVFVTTVFSFVTAPILTLFL